MNFILSVLSIAVFIVALAIFSNRWRRTYQLEFTLQPNCLMTRWPVVFITGPRSIFYFAHYWNLYPVFLAEHGYEVFTIHLPWKKAAERRDRLLGILTAEAGKKFHFVVDESTYTELAPLLNSHTCMASITRICDEEFMDESRRPFDVVVPGAPKSDFFISLSFYFHKMINKKAPTLNALGALPASALNNSHLLLARMQGLAENDYAAPLIDKDV